MAGNRIDAATVAVIIPTHNRRQSLAHALDSVHAQTLKPDEICVVDDGSDDDTGAMVRERYPSVRYIFQENHGVSAARNAGVAATDSRWLAFLDSDDRWLPEKLSRQFASLKSHPGYRLVHSDEIWIRRGRRVNPMHKHAKAGGQLFRRCLPLCAISPSAAIIRRDLFTEVGGFDECLPACEDYDLWLRICRREAVLYVDEPLLKKFGGHEDQLSRRYWGMDRFRVTALGKLLREGGLDPTQLAATRAMLQQKWEILMQGARKHGNRELIQWLHGLRREHGLRPVL